MNRKITKRQQDIFDFIVSYIEKHGYSQSVREIMSGVKLKSTSTVYCHLVRMFELGVLETDAEVGTPRAIRVPGYRFVKE